MPQHADTRGNIRAAQSFGRAYRIIDGNSYQAVFANRRRLHHSFFNLHVMQNSVTYHRLGLAVSRKVSKKAVQRNRIKRQLRDSFRLFQAANPVAPQLTGVDIVVVVKSAASLADNATLRHQINNSWEQAIKKCT